MNNLDHYDNWLNSPEKGEAITKLNELDIDYLGWSDIDIYRWSLTSEGQ